MHKQLLSLLCTVVVCVVVLYIALFLEPSEGKSHLSLLLFQKHYYWTHFLALGVV